VLLDGILDFGCRGLRFAGLELCAGRGVLELDNGVLDELEVVHVELVEETVTLVGVGGREASKGLGGDTRGHGCRGPGEETPDGPHKRRQCAARHFLTDRAFENPRPQREMGASLSKSDRQTDRQTDRKFCFYYRRSQISEFPPKP
jgi:hypothetical protein